MSRLFPLLIALGACTGPADAPKSDDTQAAVDPDAPTWHADVRPIFERSCVSCHSGPGSIGGFGLLEFDSAQAIREAIAESVATRTMPPWLADGDCNTYVDDFSLSDEEIATVVAWSDAGGPEGDIADAAPAQEPWTAPVLDRVDLSLDMNEAYTPQRSPDDYRCFIMEMPFEEPVRVTGYQFRPGNEDVVHHIIPFIIHPDDAEDYRALDAAEEGDGYTCYGGPGGELQSLINTKWLGAWAPGTGAATLPEGKGLYVAPGSLVVMQVHYNTAYNDPAPALSGVDLRIETDELEWALIQPWTEVAWVLGVGMEIPANAEGVQHSFLYESTEGDGTYAIRDASLHMHTMGRSATMRVHHADGRESCVLDMPRYDFNWQRAYGLQEPVVVEPGDVVEVTCTWDNPTDQDVSWGDGTGDEMCLGITLISDP